MKCKYKKQYQEEQFVHDISTQSLAVMMVVLERYFGFTTEQLKELKNRTEDEFKLMIDKPFRTEYNALNCIKYLKEKHGIDFDESQYTKKGK